MRTLTKTLISLALTAAVAVAPNAFARDHGRWGHHDHGWHGASHWRHGSYGHYHGGYYRHGHYDRFGRWVAGAIVASALVGLVADATAPRTVYYDAPPQRVIYRDPTVVYERAPVVVKRRVYETRVYDDAPSSTRYIRDDGWPDDGDGH
jgi:hypothetical protein